ncbi:hypothetical protein PS634_05372 [Pseudomonas fluorescens]|nr:hypothetical protein PS634_05372 [Pseudomonas fluorescens]
MPGQQLGRQLAIVLDRDGVGEREAILLGLGLFCEEARDDADVDLITGIGHSVGLEIHSEKNGVLNSSISLGQVNGK